MIYVVKPELYALYFYIKCHMYALKLKFSENLSLWDNIYLKYINNEYILEIENKVTKEVSSYEIDKNSYRRLKIFNKKRNKIIIKKRKMFFEETEKIKIISLTDNVIKYKFVKEDLDGEVEEDLKVHTIENIKTISFYAYPDAEVDTKYRYSVFIDDGIDEVWQFLINKKDYNKHGV